MSYQKERESIMKKLSLHKAAKRELEKQITRIIHQIQSGNRVNAPRLDSLKRKVDVQNTAILLHRHQLHSLDAQYMNSL